MFTHTKPIHPGSMEASEAIWVDTPESLKEMVDVLTGGGVREVAVDLEHHNVRSYHGFTCLLQISTRVYGDDGIKGWDWVVDSLKLRGELREGKLGGIMVDPSIVKVGVSSV
jgi:exosome complex exonuclease RRP6